MSSISVGLVSGVPSWQMKVVGRWWNGKFGWARRDIWLYTNGVAWRVEANENTRKDGPWARDYAGEAEARELVKAMLARSGDEWRDLTAIYESYERKPPITEEGG
jgi:hypothetical protein